MSGNYRAKVKQKTNRQVVRRDKTVRISRRELAREAGRRRKQVDRGRLFRPM